MMNFSRKKIYGAAALLLLAAMIAFNLQGDPEPEKRVRLTFEKTTQGGLQAFVQSSIGKKTALTFGTFLSACMEAQMGQAFTKCKLNTGDPLLIYYEKEDGVLVANIENPQGQKSRLLFNNLLLALPTTLSGCTGQKLMQIPPLEPNVVKIFFQKDQSGQFQTYIMHPDGRQELLNFGNLLSATAELFKNCQAGQASSSMLYIDYENNPTGINPETLTPGTSLKTGLQAVQIDATGVKEQVNLDNLVTAASETLQNCGGNAAQSSPFTPPAKSIKIRFDKDGNGQLTASLASATGDRITLNLGTLLVAAVSILPCEAPATEGKKIDIIFSSEPAGKTVIIDAQGNKTDFNDFGNLLDAIGSYCPKS